jgi:hypothetical protein
MIHINRFVDYGTKEEGTFGSLSFHDFFCYTVECPWLNNQKWISCIPPGDYYLERYQSPKFGNVAIIYGNDVSKFPDHNYKLSGILIHPANFSYQLKGCIGLGDVFTTIDGKIGVTNSRKTVADFLNLINIFYLISDVII